MAKGQRSITVPEKLFEEVEATLPKTNYNSVAAYTQYLLNKALEDLKQKEASP